MLQGQRESKGGAPLRPIDMCQCQESGLFPRDLPECGAIRVEEFAVALRGGELRLQPPSPEVECSGFHSAFRFFKIFFANGSLISMCLGTASITPFFGLIQRECEVPSLFK